VSTKTPKRKRTAAAAAPVPEAATAVQVPNVVAAHATPTVALASNCTVKEAVGLKQSLCDVVNAAEPVTLDVAGVERVDTAILQLLCAFVQARTAANRAVTWGGSSSALFDSARQLGLQAALALPQK